jgi:hypothetical protein
MLEISSALHLTVNAAVNAITLVAVMNFMMAVCGLQKVFVFMRMDGCDWGAVSSK